MKIKEEIVAEPKKEEENENTHQNLHKNRDFQEFLMNRRYARFSRVYSS